MDTENSTYTNTQPDEITIAQLIKTCEELIKIREEAEAEERAQRVLVAKKMFRTGVITRGQAATVLVAFGVKELDVCSILEEWDHESSIG